MHEKALLLRRTGGDRVGEAMTLCRLGEAKRALGRDAEALADFERSAALAEKAHAPRTRMDALAEAGRLHLAAGRLPGARTSLEAALGLAGTLGARQSRALIGVYLARTLLAAGATATGFVNFRLPREARGLVLEYAPRIGNTNKPRDSVVARDLGR